MEEVHTINSIGLLVGIDCMGASGGFRRREGLVKPGAHLKKFQADFTPLDHR